MRLKDKGIMLPDQRDCVPNWTRKQLEQHIYNDDRCLVLLDGYIVDVTSYLSEHVCISHLLGTWWLTAGNTARRSQTYSWLRSRENDRQYWGFGLLA